MNDWGYVALGYGGAVLVVAGYVARLLLHARRAKRS
jgi:hypothetical protein